MVIDINGERKALPQPMILSALLEQLGYKGGAFAVALNGDFVARTEYAGITVTDGDALDIVAPVVGG